MDTDHMSTSRSMSGTNGRTLIWVLCEYGICVGNINTNCSSTHPLSPVSSLQNISEDEVPESSHDKKTSELYSECPFVCK